MKRVGIILILAFIAPNHLIWGQSPVIKQLVGISPHSLSATEIEGKISGFCASVRKGGDNDYLLLKKVFRQTHQKFLKNYRPYSQFNELIEKGNYDCLSATALFSLILNDMGYDYKIIETNYHIFMLVNTSDGEVLIETTDRFNGLEKRGEKIKERMNNYSQNILASAKSNPYIYQCNLFKPVETHQLAGLLLFNQAVSAFNDRSWEMCIQKLNDSASIYESARVPELASLLSQAVQSAEVDENIKTKIVERCKKYVSKNAPVVAAR